MNWYSNINNKMNYSYSTNVNKNSSYNGSYLRSNYEYNVQQLDIYYGIGTFIVISMLFHFFFSL